MIRRTKARMRLCVLLLCLILMFIWGNSLLPREASEKLSQGVKAMLSGILPSVGSGSEGNGHHILRKVAHFFEFCCLGLCLSWLVRMLRKAPWELYILPLLGGVLVACLDETIQCFVPGRGPGLKDVGIDTLGIILGVVIISLIQFLIGKKLTNNLEENKQ